MICGSCGHENPASQKFCGECGGTLSNSCPSCGLINPAGQKFCGECGTPIAQGAVAAAAAPAPAHAAPIAERRLVSVLFADLVGFTTLSESRDAEEVRELLSKYFETCRTLIGRYGGVVEKFIGDAVMAVWGTPTATEDDAERAVRAALDLTRAVAEMGVEAGAPELRARAGVLTGEAAVTIGAEGQGMVAGDLVNTASRIQSAAEPGRVFVGEATMRSSEASIVYEDAGDHEMKGKAEPMHLWRAVRVVAGSLGALRQSGLEAPFVGRDRELRMIKELFHASAEENKAALVSITGIGGIGKSRLSWEFEKYIDGLAETSLWHRGRCLSYGEGVAYWALVDMVKMRCRIAEEEDSASALSKLRATIEEFIPDPKERDWVEPRLRHLLALDGGATGDQENVFSAWRIFFERMAARYPVVMVFEDMQWADAGLLDFIEYLLEWSRSLPIFILGLARPELADKRPTWGAGKRSFSSLYLEPLSAEAMELLLSGLVPGLPDDIRSQILDRAQGVPLYAVETVRMLLDRGLLVREGDVYQPTGPIESLDVPETLHGLIAARLDGLAPEERRVIQDGAVLGKTFFKQGIARVAGLSEEEAEQILSSLVRKEVVSLQADPRSPERGQYGFLQDLVRKVAYDTLSKKERKSKHLAAAAFIEEGWTGEEDEIVEVVAAHYLSAYEAAPEAKDAGEIRDKAREHLVVAGERAASLAAPAEAQRYFEQASGLADDPRARAGLYERAGHMALVATRYVEARKLLGESLDLLIAEGDTRAVARVTARLSEADRVEGRLEEAVARMEEAFSALVDEGPDENLATLAAELGRQHFFLGEMDVAAERLEVALEISEKLELWETVAEAINTKGFAAIFRGRPEEATALHRHALFVALEHDHPAAALRAYFNLAEVLVRRDRYDEALVEYEAALALARRVGNRFWETALMNDLPYVLTMSGMWDDAIDSTPGLDDPETAATADVVGRLLGLPEIHVNRGDMDAAQEVLPPFERYERSADLQERAVYSAGRAVVLRGQGRNEEALDAAMIGFEAGERIGMNHLMVKTAFIEAVESALAAGDTVSAARICDRMRAVLPGERMRFLTGHLSRLEAKLTDDPAIADEKRVVAIRLFREIGAPFWLAVSLTEAAEQQTLRGGEPIAALIEEAGGIFERLRATPWLERLDAIATARVGAPCSAPTAVGRTSPARGSAGTAAPRWPRLALRAGPRTNPERDSAAIVDQPWTGPRRPRRQ